MTFMYIYSNLLVKTHVHIPSLIVQFRMFAQIINTASKIIILHEKGLFVDVMNILVLLLY